MGAYGIFFVTGLAVGAIYALSGVGLVVLYRSTGVLNLAYGAIGGMGAMLTWQIEQWDYPEAAAWVVAILVATLLSLAYGRLVAPYLDYREPVVKAVATLGYALIILGICNYFWVEAPRRLALFTDSSGFSLLGIRITGTRGARLPGCARHHHRHRGVPQADADRLADAGARQPA